MCFVVNSVVVCPAEGQIFTSDCLSTATCDNLNIPKSCNGARCICPDGLVLDEEANACVNQTECCKLL